MFTHIPMLQEDWTLWHKLKSLCQPDCLMLCWLCDKTSLYRSAGIVSWSKQALMLLNPSCGLTCFLPSATSFFLSCCILIFCCFKACSDVYSRHNNFRQIGIDIPIFFAMLGMETGGCAYTEKSALMVILSFCWSSPRILQGERQQESCNNFWIGHLCNVIVKYVFKTKHVLMFLL